MADRITDFLKKSNVSNHFVALAVVLVVLMLLIPVSGPFLDFLMITNVAISLVILLVVLYTPKGSKITAFPRVILFTTIYGVALNICSTRFILTNGHVGFDSFKGAMIKSFANIVSGGEVAVGFIIFIILIIFQVVVVTKGAGRISEVAARFALDSMNSKMFAVDSELQSGFITDEQAGQKKNDIQKESDFYSAMDGASKFVSGNVKAGIAITAINLVGGIIWAMYKYGMRWADAIQTFPQLTIGDGLLSQLPSVLISVATGILVAGSGSEEVFGEEIKKQFNPSGNVFIIAGSVLCLMGICFHTTAMLIILLLGIGVSLIFIGYHHIKNQDKAARLKLEAENAAKAGKQTGQNPSEVSPVVPLDALSLELGVALLDLVDQKKGAELLARIKRMRTEAAIDMGLVIPNIRIQDNLTLDPTEYSFKIRGIEAGRAKLKIGYYMCMDTGLVREPLNGEATRDPAFGVPAIWVPESDRALAEKNGYSVVDTPTIIATHMTEIIHSHASEIITRQEVSAIIEKIKESNPVVVDEVLNKCKYTYGDIEKVFQGLLRERVSIRNIVAILECLANYENYKSVSWLLIEKVREALGKQICLQYIDDNDPDKKLTVVRLSQEWAEKINSNISESKDGSVPVIAFDPADQRKWYSSINSVIPQLIERNIRPVILCPTPEIRILVYNSIERELPGTVCLSINEVVAAGRSINLEIIGDINLSE